MSDKVVNLLFILDESGSMGTIKEEAISGYNTFIAKQKEQPGSAEISLYAFNYAVRKIKENEPLETASDLTNKEYIPSGMTALFDAIGHVVSEFKNSGRNTVLAILTDGEENSSKSYNYESVKKLLTEVQDDLGWDVTFLGANIKEIHKFTNSIGIKEGKGIAFAANAVGLSNAYDSIAESTTTARMFFASQN